MRMTAQLGATRPLTRSAVLAAFAVGLALTVRVPLLPAAPFLLYEPSDVPLLIGALMLGPAWAAGIAVVVAAVLGLVGGGGIIGALSRLVGSMALGVTAGWAYRHFSQLRHRGAISVSLGIGAYVVSEVLMSLLLGPLFLGSFQTAAAMILPVVLPFNLIKGVVNGVASLAVLRAVQGTTAMRGGRA